MSNANIKSKLSELNKKAHTIKTDPKLRHAPNEHDVLKASENTRLMQAYQYQTVKQEDND